jgi:uncharacterized protein YcbK (DUF882 family)
MSRNLIKSYIFGGNAEAQTPQELERQRAMIEAMSPNFGSAQNVGEGIGHALTGLAMGIRARRANKAEKAGKASGAKVYNDIMDRAFSQPAASQTQSDNPPTSDIEPKVSSKQKIKKALQDKKQGERVEVASLEPKQVSQPKSTGKGLAALDRGGNLKYSKDWQREGQDEKISQVVAGAGQEMGRDIGVTSGHRPLAYNRAIGSSDGSKHVTGEAMDISMAGMDDKTRQRLIQELTQRGAGRFITYDSMPDTLHVDTGKRDGQFEPRFMHNKSAHNMGRSPQWYQGIAERDGVLLPSGASAPIPAPTPNVGNPQGNMSDPDGLIQPQTPQIAPAMAMLPENVPTPAETPAQAIAQNFDNPAPQWDGKDIKGGILAAANELGVDPVDLATAISYETAGTFDPTKAGPTTQWGQHRGLIQFGVPQSKQYGVDWNNPVGSQLGPDGAIVKYLRDNGVKEGMGLLDIYSAINAGEVGLYNRTDANNGGARGTVRDKVMNQMSGHREKALAMFGDQPVNQPQNINQVDPRQMLQNGPVQVASLNPNDAADLMQSPPSPMGYAPKGSSVNLSDVNNLPIPASTQNQGSRVTLPQNPPVPAPTLQRPTVGGSGGIDPQLQQQQAQPQAPQQMQQQAPVQVAQNNQIGIRELIEASQNPWLSDGQRSTIQMLLERELQQSDPLRQLEIKKMQQELATGDPNYMSPADKLAREKFEYERNKPDLATSSKEYEYYKREMDRLGQPALGPLEYRRALKAAGAQNTTVNVNSNSNKFIEENDKLAAKRMNDVIVSGNAAPELIGQLRQLSDLSRVIGTGKGAQVKLALGPYAQAMGIEIDGLGEMESFRAITSRLAPQMRPVGSGSSSDKDVQLFLDSLPAMSNTPEGNALIAATFEAVMGHRVKAAEIAALSQRPPQYGGITWQEAEQRIRALPNPYEQFLKSQAARGSSLNGASNQSLKDKYGLE